MKYCYIQNNNVEQMVDPLPTQWRNISNMYVLPNEELKKHGWLPVKEVGYDGTLDLGFHIYPDYVLLIKQDEVPQIDNEPSPEEEWQNIRNERNHLLAETDKLVLFDVYEKFSQEQQQQIKNYRQQLRDIPQTFEEPNLVVWPHKLWD
jgi:hypothetical protein